MRHAGPIWATSWPPKATTPPSISRPNCGGVPMLVVGNYFYVYYNERTGGANSDLEYPAVARAKISSVLAAAASDTVPAFYKYNDGAWTQPAIDRTGFADPPNSVSTNADWLGFGAVPTNHDGRLRCPQRCRLLPGPGRIYPHGGHRTSEANCSVHVHERRYLGQQDRGGLCRRQLAAVFHDRRLRFLGHAASSTVGANFDI